ncbi:recombinase family protein [Insolitispirillum peregrinum]|uniref:Site-specific DNA recombinase n=1 Tax=Insolitispirillum peregrinum TaxID=80876 RepID=A0A1N7PDG5_9PROT|nr:recombinase family protein [Insolitispirillum peregrinum]SIT08641.1 Site-specific DNA recombinase [Insolitispirillum peregrinum]
MSKRVAFYARVSTDSQTVENQVRELHEVASRLGWNVIAVIADEGISGAKGRDQRPGFDKLLKGIARKDFDLVAAWSVDRLGRSLRDLVILLDDMRDRGVDLYLHQQGLDTSTPTGRAMFGMLSVFSDFERSLIRSRVISGLNRVRGTKRLDRPPTPPITVEKVKRLLASGSSVRATAKAVGISTGMVSKIKAQMVA